MVEAYLLREEGETVVDIDVAEREEQEEKPEKALFCKFCGQLITYANHAVEVNDRHNHTFFNPAGIIFEIRCFSHAEGCSVRGTPSNEFTWFAGYSWSIAVCSSCVAHMGWFFNSGDVGFYGLIAKNLAT